MISEDRRMRGWRAFCSEPYENIENYEEAMTDSEHLWHCHHRREIDDDGTTHSVDELKSRGLYYNRPAAELVFLRNDEHMRLHGRVREWSQETCNRISEAKMGHTVSEETRRRLSEANTGKRLSEERRRQISLALIGNTHTLGHFNNPGCSSRVQMIRGDGKALEFPSIREAVRWLKGNGFPNAGHANISKCCSGTRSSAYGAKWSYLDSSSSN